MSLLQLLSLSTVWRSFKRKLIDLRFIATFRWKCGQILGKQRAHGTKWALKRGPFWRHWKEALELNDDDKNPLNIPMKSSHPAQQVGRTEFSRDGLLRSIACSPNSTRNKWISLNLRTGAVLSHAVSHCVTVLTLSRSDMKTRPAVKVTRVGKQVATVCLQHRTHFSFSLKASDWIYSKESPPDDFLHKLVCDWKKNKEKHSYLCKHLVLLIM